MTYRTAPAPARPVSRSRRSPRFSSSPSFRALCGDRARRCRRPVRPWRSSQIRRPPHPSLSRPRSRPNRRRRRRRLQQQMPPAQPQPGQQAQQPGQNGQQPVQLIYSPWTKFCLKGQPGQAPDPNTKAVISPARTRASNRHANCSCRPHRAGRQNWSRASRWADRLLAVLPRLLAGCPAGVVRVASAAPPAGRVGPFGRLGRLRFGCGGRRICLLRQGEGRRQRRARPPTRRSEGGAWRKSRKGGKRPAHRSRRVRRGPIGHEMQSLVSAAEPIDPDRLAERWSISCRPVTRHRPAPSGYPLLKGHSTQNRRQRDTAK